MLEFRDIALTLGNRKILRGVSLKLEEGETIVLLGRSGSGKTSLLRCANGLLVPSSGDVLFNGESLQRLDLIRTRRKIGYVIQDAGLFPHFTVAQNVGLVPRLEKWPESRIETRVSELLNLVGLTPEDYAGRYPRELSGGQRQRIGIARALAADPALLLLDEPFGALDPITRFDLQKQFRQLRNELRKTSLFVTHDVREALMMATRIALLMDGMLEFLGTPDEFLSAGSSEVKAFRASLEQAA
ncbi:MAG: ATP-binding cassette domain-containing protein [Bryobacteraceae bacterium]|nr:ATP-binding cassette domain-containing protein [Bryobacteraceae bacterium]